MTDSIPSPTIATNNSDDTGTGLPAPATRAEQALAATLRPPLLPERSDFLDGDAPAADKVATFLANALEASAGAASVAGALVPWICDALLSNHSVKAYGRDFTDFVRHMQAQGGSDRLEVTHPDRLKVTHLGPEVGHAGQGR